MQTVQGRCPACGWASLFLGDGGYVTCSRLECPRPDLVTELIGEIADARRHAGYTFCSQDVGHVTMREFAKKITEKVTAVAHREEAVAYTNEQKQRADRLHAEITALRDDLYGVTGARWIADMLDTILNGPTPDPSAGPSVAECAAQDRAHWADKYAGEGQ